MKTAATEIPPVTDEVNLFEGFRFYVYELRDDAGKVFYVGKGTGRRIKDHQKLSRMSGSPKYAFHLYRKLAKLRRENEVYQEAIVFWTDCEDEAHTEERRLIAHYGRKNLCNMTDGGEGTSGYKVTEEAKAHLRKLNTGKKVSEETKQRIGDSIRGVKRSAETRQRMSEAALRKPRISEETRQRYRDARKGIVITAEWRAAINAGLHRGENNHAAKLNAEAVWLMRVEYAKEKITFRELAAQYGVTIAAAGKAVRGNTWTHVPFP